MIAYPSDEPALRLDGIRRIMDKEGLSALLVYGRQWRSECIHYTSNYRMLGDRAYLLIPLDAEPSLFISEENDLQRAAAESWIGDIRILDESRRETPIEAAGAFKGTVGIAGLEYMGLRQYRMVERHIGMRLRNALYILDRAAKIKSLWELQLIAAGGDLADLGFRTELAVARPGIREFELAAEIDYAMAVAGADDNFQMLSAGKDLDCMHVPRENAVKEGDLVLSEITPFVGSFNYAAQLCRTAKIGKATARERDAYAVLVEALEEALAVIRPGTPIKEIALKQNAVIGKAGYEKYCRPPYMRSRGHNFGLGQFEIVDENDDVLHCGMTMVVHPNQFIPELGYLACGETVCVTENGVKRLSKLPAKLYETELGAL
jgi:Xaa-Pro aminopeptidase